MTTEINEEILRPYKKTDEIINICILIGAKKKSHHIPSFILNLTRNKCIGFFSEK